MAALLQRANPSDADYVSCPKGGYFYVCEDVNYYTFVGCCSSNPCSNQMCSYEDLWPMGFGIETSPAPDYPNHSCPYGGLWYTCADNPIPFQGCCEIDPCNGYGCPYVNLVAAGVHTVEVAGGSTFTVPATVNTEIVTSSTNYRDTSTRSTGLTGTTGRVASTTTNYYVPSFSASSSSKVGGNSIGKNTAIIAGGASAGGILVAILIGIAVYFYKRRTRLQAQPPKISLMPAAPSKDTKDRQEASMIAAPALTPAPSAAATPLPTYSVNSSPFPTGTSFSPTSSYVNLDLNKTDSMAASEIMGTELTQEEFKHRTMSRALGQARGESVELGLMPFSAADFYPGLRNISFVSRPQSDTQRVEARPPSRDTQAVAGGMPANTPRG